eukprot:1011960-Prorocentrum_minimum.AAC.1
MASANSVSLCSSDLRHRVSCPSSDIQLYNMHVGLEGSGRPNIICGREVEILFREQKPIGLAVGFDQASGTMKVRKRTPSRAPIIDPLRGVEFPRSTPTSSATLRPARDTLRVE